MVGSSGVDIESWSSWGVRYSVSMAEASFLMSLEMGCRFILVGGSIRTLLCGANFLLIKTLCM